MDGQFFYGSLCILNRLSARLATLGQLAMGQQRLMGRGMGLQGDGDGGQLFVQRGEGIQRRLDLLEIGQ